MTNKTKDGGSAYPENVALCPNTGQVYPASEFHAQLGMTLRQYYAGQALQGVLASWGNHDVTDHRDIVHDCFVFADAMIAHEEAKNDG